MYPGQLGGLILKMQKYHLIPPPFFVDIAALMLSPLQPASKKQQENATMSSRRTRTSLTVLAFAALATATLATTASADTPPQFAKVFTDHAVLQRAEPVHVWGTATPSHQLTVTVANQSVTATADAAGKWSAIIPALTAGGPYTLTVTDADGSKTTLNDIMAGDVYLCSGQSNMQFPARIATGAWGEIGGSANTNIRFINVQNDSEAAVQPDLKLPAAWKVAGPDTTGEASAVCYYMAKTLQKDQNVPVGFIDSFWGGTTVQGWISEDSLRTVPAYATGVDAIKLFATDPAKAMADQSKQQEAWWDAHDPAAKANRAFISPKFDDSKWATLNPTSSWKDTGIAEFKDFDGVAWFRTSVTLTADQAAKANEITLGPIDTFDSTWVNGTWVGSGAMSWLWRDYNVPAGVFKEGKNIIVLRVLGGGGLTGSPSNRFVKMSDGQAVPIIGAWTYKVGMPAKGLSVPATPWAIPTSLSTLYNGMIAPVTGYTIKLAAWYQGEANAYDGKEYRTLLPLLIKDWRERFNKPELPFLVAQLSSFGSVSTKAGKSDWAELREAQRLTVANDPHAGLAVTIDVGDRTDIHPTQKTVVGQRLARAARAIAYGENISPGGPEATGVTRSGADLVIAFKNTQGSLLTYSSKQAIGFETCTATDVCDFTSAVVTGDQIVLPGANDAKVISVRYAWSNAPYVNLYSADDQPAVPFQLPVAP